MQYGGWQGYLPRTSRMSSTKQCSWVSAHTKASDSVSMGRMLQISSPARNSCITSTPGNRFHWDRTVGGDRWRRHRRRCCPGEPATGRRGNAALSPDTGRNAGHPARNRRSPRGRRPDASFWQLRWRSCATRDWLWRSNVSGWRLGEHDASGRPRPVPQPGSEFVIQATAIIVAISQEPDFAGLEDIRAGNDGSGSMIGETPDERHLCRWR